MPNTLVQAAAEGLPKITRRLFLRNTAAVAGVATIATVAVADEAPLPTRTAKEEAIWHLRELERLLKEDGAKRYVVMVVGNNYSDGHGAKCIQITEDAFRDDDSGMFAPKGGDA
jgi:hypothetical protein